MAPDLTKESPLFLVKDIPKQQVVSARQGGRRMHQRTGFRWVFDGVEGVRLESVMIGGQRYTTGPALERWFVAVTAARARRCGKPSGAPAQRQGDSDAVEAELDRFGI